MDTATGTLNPPLPTPKDEDIRRMANLADEADADREKQDDLDRDDDPVTPEVDEKVPLKAPADQKGPQKSQAMPDVRSDRVPATDAEPEGSLDHVKTAALGIQDIENLEDDAKGG